ncbi:hypothetical protein BBO99_00005803 [Phytophthora kernoviae]|uniref:Ku domain-containing protein n=2 Tax=Phytophthora kernoviae TaxID=325452 RepID=A0A3R7FX95_9STRA|nr:hypothetical protein G195_006520 [Phytophthora kernoviae 00238/432]KAG2523106.1 hypothetical protein JM16_005471 [Phytophthora kernoviae]RLN05990.1 hypothetical protein BBI17_005896 [Phytophthora kernoviae]RLN78666.1 hypothetical protein BBO99_00005803 [Phytophthora kernoviae]
MDVWGSQNTVAGEQMTGEEEDWELAESGKDALIVLLDIRKAMLSPYPHAAEGAPTTWFHAVVELVIKLLKSKVIANDNSLLSVIFFGMALLDTDVQSTFEPMENSESFKDYSVEDDVDSESSYQPAFSVGSLDELMDGSLRKRFRKRRLTTFPLHVTKGVSIGVELYALVVAQRKNTPVALDASTNTPLKTETKWLCEDTGVYLTPDQIKKYIDYGGKRVYFTRDDVVQIKHYDAPGLQLICFKPSSSLKWNENIRAPYFVYPCDGYIEGSSTAFKTILNSMVKKKKIALARLIARKTSEPRLVALVPQKEVNDEMGQLQPSGFNVIFLPYLDDIRDIPVGAVPTVGQEKIDAAKNLISKLKLTEAPNFENPALALDEEILEFDESKDTTLPDAEGFGQGEAKDAITIFRDVCGAELLDASNSKRKSSTSGGRKTTTKKSAKVKEGAAGKPVAEETFDKEEWAALTASDAIQKKTVAQLKAFLHAHGAAAVGRKAELIDAVKSVLEG